MTFSISDHKNSKRVRVIKFNESDLERLVFPFKRHSILSLEYRPFSRFSLAKSLDEVFENKLSKTLIDILNDRKTGTAIIEPEINNKKFDKDFLVKLSTGLAYLVGNPNFFITWLWANIKSGAVSIKVPSKSKRIVNLFFII